LLRSESNACFRRDNAAIMKAAKITIIVLANPAVK